MVIGIITDANKTSSLLDNLSEADFNDVSVIMQDENKRNALASDNGPLKGTNVSNIAAVLTKYHLTQSEINKIITALQQGHVLVAIQTDKAFVQAAVEMLTPYKAQYIKTL